MTIRQTIVLLLLIAWTAPNSTASEVPAAPSAHDVQLAVEKGLFFVEQTAIRWWQERKCASCHDGPMLLFSHNIAKRQGFPFDQKKLDFWTDRWILVDGLVHKRKDGRKDAGGMLSAPLTMLFRDLEKEKDPQRAEKFGKLVQIAGSEWQADDGSWKVGSKLNYGPWIALALESIAKSEMPLDDRVRAEILDRSKRTQAWIAKSSKDGFPERTENVASWMVYEHRTGNKDRARKLLDELRRRRREDGTWGITEKSESGHLIITGAVLFALTSIGLDTTDPLVASTQRLLLERQRNDGRWEEGGRIFDDGSDYENPVFNLWATALICAGLSQTIELPEGTKPAFTPDPEKLAAVNKMAAAAGDGYTGTEANPVDKDFSDEPAPASSRDKKQNKERAGYENSLGMKMIRVEPGEFVMGSDHGDWDEKPNHQVRITRPFFIGATEVTNAQYEQFDPDHRKLRGKLEFSKRDDEAVVFVSWQDAVRFCQWLSKKEGKPYRLPTEAEWEYACRAGTTTAFHAGQELPKSFHKNVLRDSWHGGWYPSPQSSAGTWYASREDAVKNSVFPLTVAQTPPNPWGLFDMHGNVEEWCSDWYGPYSSGRQLDPVGPPVGDFRVTRGGSHSTELKYLRSANRMGTLSDDKHWLIGFRVVQGDLPNKSRDYEETPVQNQQKSSRPAVNPQADVTKRDNLAPYFEGPRLFVKIPPGSNGPLFSRHSHAPAIIDCSYGDLLAIWYTCRDEPGRELAIAASRLRPGEAEWEPAQPFWDAPDRNDHTLRLCRDDQGKLYHFNGLSAAATWGNLAVVMRTSTDSGKTWSKAQLIMPEHNGGAGAVLRLRSGTMIMVGESRAGPNVAGGYLWMSKDNGRTWTSSQPKGSPPQAFTPGMTGSWIAGTHITLVEMKDGRLLALARGSDINGRMPQSVSADGGHTWTYQASPFDPIAGRQRPVLLRLREGPILFASFAKSLRTTDRRGKEFEYSGLFAALSYDEGKTWKIKRPITIDGPPRKVEGIGKRNPVTISPQQGEPTGYLAVCQSADGVVQLVTSRNHYAFNLAWLETNQSPAGKNDLRTSNAPQSSRATNRDRPIDQLFTKWNRPDVPGCAVGVVQDGQLIYGKGFGSANLDYAVANTTRTVFEAGSMTKSFTCACIALLLDQGKIAPDDDIRQFMPEMHAHDPPIRIRHLIRCRSGLWAQWHLVQLAGWSSEPIESPYTAADLLALLRRQKTLPFEPGTQFRYGSSDWFLLGQIVQRVTGKTLAQFAQENLFQPLGMTGTHFIEDPTHPIKQRAVGHYIGAGGTWRQWSTNMTAVGGWGLQTCVDDLLRWEQNLLHNRLPAGRHLGEFIVNGTLLDNRNVLEVRPTGRYRGLQCIRFTGGMPGFSAAIVRFPAQRFAVCCLANNGEILAWDVAERIADVCLVNVFPEPPPESKTVASGKPVAIPNDVLKRRAGFYRMEKHGRIWRFTVHNGKLVWTDHLKQTYPLESLSPTRFRPRGSPIDDNEFVFQCATADSPAKLTLKRRDGETTFVQVELATPAEEQLTEYSGKYFSDELDLTYSFTLRDGALWMRVGNRRWQRLQPTLADEFIPAAAHGDFDNRLIRFRRNERRRVTGMAISLYRVTDIKFKRLTTQQAFTALPNLPSLKVAGG